MTTENPERFTTMANTLTNLIPDVYEARSVDMQVHLTSYILPLTASYI